MILENNLQREGFGYAQLLLAAYHTDAGGLDISVAKSYTRVTELWSFDTQATHDALRVDDPQAANSEAVLSSVFDILFPGLRQRMWKGKLNDDYNNAPEELHTMNLWLLQADAEDLVAIWGKFFDHVKSGPQGGDDDTYDYWPSAWGLMLHMFEDLVGLGVFTWDHLSTVQAAWDEIARRYPTNELAEDIGVPRPVAPEHASL